MQEIIILGLIAVILIQQALHSKERKDLYSRIMAKDLTEYRLEPQKKKDISKMRNKVKEYQKNWR